MHDEPKWGMARKPALSARDIALREIGQARLTRLAQREEKIRRHLESERGRNDWQTLHFLLHQIEVERNDLYHNLKKEDYVPKPGKTKRERSAPVLAEPIKPMKAQGNKPVKGQTKHRIPKPVPGTNLPRLINSQLAQGLRRHDDEFGRAWSSAPFVEVQLPSNPEKVNAIVKALRGFKIDDERAVVRAWAAALGQKIKDQDPDSKKTSLETAKEALLTSAQIGHDLSKWRIYLSMTRNSSYYENWTDEQVQAAMQPEAKGEASRAKSAVIRLAAKPWVDQTVKSIKDSAPKGIDKDTLDRRLRAGLNGFFTAANNGKHTNPQFPYLTDEKPMVPIDSVTADVMAFLDIETDKERYKQNPEDDKKRHRVTILQKELGKAKPRQRMELSNEKWAGKPTIQGTITRRRDAALIWECKKAEDGLQLAIQMGGCNPIDPNQYTYQDGAYLTSDNQLITDKGKGKSCAVLPLILKHDFRRWYAKHIDNHIADAPRERRCLHNTTQFVVVDPDGPNPRLFIRPVFKFYEPNREVPDTHEAWKKPDCRYLIGIDRGINYILRAVVVDTLEKKVIADIALPGRKQEWKKIRDEIAYWQQMRDLARNQGQPNAHFIRAIALARRKDRALGRTAAVEAVAQLVEMCERSYGSGSYCFVLEDLDMGKMNLKRNNRVKQLATVEDALINQMRKRGYRHYPKTGKVDGVRFEGAWYTSQVSPDGWWAKKEEIESEWKDGRKLPIGRRVGQCYEMPEDRQVMVYRRGERRKPRDDKDKPYGRSRFCVEPGDQDPAKPRRNSWGSELFWDPHCTNFKGREFPQGVVLDADFVGALNIALRPVVKDGQAKGFKAAQMAEAHTKLNPTFEICCKVTAYEFSGTEDDPRQTLRKVEV